MVISVLRHYTQAAPPRPDRLRRLPGGAPPVCDGRGQTRLQRPAIRGAGPGRSDPGPAYPVSSRSGERDPTGRGLCGGPARRRGRPDHSSDISYFSPVHHDVQLAPI